MSIDAPVRSGPALARLRAATRPQHDRIESALDLMRPGFDLSSYRRFIERSYGFISACERAIDVADAPVALDVPERLKSHLLREDLRALGLTADDIDALPLADRIPGVRDWPAALGYFYVIEGSTLGGQVLSRHFRDALGLPDEAMAFLHSYGRNVGPMWKSMLQVLESAMSDPSAEHTITAAAAGTFELLTAWHSRAVRETSQG